MGDKKVFHTEKAAVTGGPYAQAVIHDGLIYVSRQGAGLPFETRVEIEAIAHL